MSNPMGIDQALVSEIERQLKDDILYYGWICQIVRLLNSAYTEMQCVESVVNAVLYLHIDKRILIGDASEIDGMVHIQPWLESKENLRYRIRSAFSRFVRSKSSFLLLDLQ